jgi:polysaccharide biosynthesis/export protein
MNARKLVWAGISAAALLAGCKHTTGPKFDPSRPSALETSRLLEGSTNRLNAEWLQRPTNFFTLGPGDRLEIEVLGDPDSRATTVVGPDGKVYYHLLPGIDVWGLTLAQAKDQIQTDLLKFIRDSPKVALSLRSAESQRVWLLGRFNSPGVYPINGPTTLLEAISLAKGPSSVGNAGALAGGTVTVDISGTSEEAADLRRSFVIRKGKLLPVDFNRLLKDGDMAQNIYLEPDDFVYLPSAVSRNVYVLGAVAQPKSVPFNQEVTLIAALASAGGTIKDAYRSHVAIVRGSLTEPQIAIMDYDDIVRGKAPNVVLAPQDIVYVPFTPYRTVTRYVDLILNTFVRTVGANEGARAVKPGAAPVSPNVSIGGLGGSTPGR